MVEAAMVLPIFILTVLSLMFVMVFYYEVHHGQILLHQELLQRRDYGTQVFYIEKEEQVQHNQVEGMANLLVRHKKSHRIYILKPAKWIQAGEMAASDAQ